MSDGKKIALTWTAEQALAGEGSEPARRNLYASLQQIVAALNLNLVGEGNLDEALALKVGVQPFSAFPDAITTVSSLDTTTFVTYGGVAGSFGSGNFPGAGTTIAVGNEVDATSGRPVYYTQFTASTAGATSLSVGGSQAIRVPNGFTRWETAALRVQHRMSSVPTDVVASFKVTVRNTPPQVAASIVRTRAVTTADTGYAWVEFSAEDLAAWGPGDPLVYEFEYTTTAGNGARVLRIAAIEFNWR